MNETRKHPTESRREVIAATVSIQPFDPVILFLTCTAMRYVVMMMMLLLLLLLLLGDTLAGFLLSPCHRFLFCSSGLFLTILVPDLTVGFL